MVIPNEPLTPFNQSGLTQSVVAEKDWYLEKKRLHPAVEIECCKRLLTGDLSKVRDVRCTSRYG